MTEVLPRDILLRVGGRTLQRTGFLAAMGAGRGYVEVKETVSRPDASTCATFVDRDLVPRLAAADKVRIEYPSALSGLVDQFGYPYCGPLPEGSRLQLVAQPENFGHASWTVQGIVALTAGQADPFGGTGAYLLDSNTPGAGDSLFTPIVYTGDGTKAVSVFMRQGSSPTSDLLAFDQTAAVERARFRVTWTAGVPSAAMQSGSGTIFPPQKVIGGWYRLPFAANNIVAANTNRVYLYPDPNAGGGTTFFFGAQAENAAFPGSYLRSAVTHAADAITVPLNVALQALTIQGDFLHPSSDAGVRGVFHLGAAGANSRIFELNWSGTKYRVTHGDAATGYVEASAVATPSPGDRVRIAACLYPDGHVTIEQAINSGGAAAVVVQPATKALAAITQQVLVGRRDVGFEQYGPILESKLIRNVRTLAECEAAP